MTAIGLVTSSLLWLPLLVTQLVLPPVHGHSHIVETEIDGEPTNPLRNKDFVLDRGHAREHSQGKHHFNPETTSEGMIAFQFFSSHDSDKDGKLDGLELYHALEHGLEDTLDNIFHNKPERREQGKINLRGSYVRSVDRMLVEDDTDKDGYLSYREFSVARTTGSILKAQ